MSVGEGVVNGPRGPSIGQGREPGPPGSHGALPLDPEGLCLQPQGQGRERRAVGAQPDILTARDKEPPYTGHPHAWDPHTKVDTPGSEGHNILTTPDKGPPYTGTHAPERHCRNGGTDDREPRPTKRSPNRACLCVHASPNSRDRP